MTSRHSATIDPSDMDIGIVSFYHHSAPEAVNISTETIQCGLCGEIMDPAFVMLQCSHRLCSTCAIGCGAGTGAGVKCPLCRCVEPGVFDSSRAFLVHVLADLPRVVSCGQTVPRFSAIQAHEDNCLDCILKTTECVRAEMDAISRNNKHLRKMLEENVL
jgi:hypothetical protein